MTTLGVVKGLDISLTGTGIAGISPAGEAWTATVSSAPEQTAGLSARGERIDYVVDTVLSYFTAGDRVLVEGPSYGSRVGHAWDRAACWWGIIRGLQLRECVVAEITPGGLKKWATGKGNSSKLMVVLALGRLFPDVDIEDDDQADALAMSHLLAVKAGYPVPTRAQHVAANWKAVAWPETTEGES